MVRIKCHTTIRMAQNGSKSRSFQPNGFRTRTKYFFVRHKINAHFIFKPEQPANDRERERKRLYSLSVRRTVCERNFLRTVPGKERFKKSFVLPNRFPNENEIFFSFAT